MRLDNSAGVSECREFLGKENQIIAFGDFEWSWKHQPCIMPKAAPLYWT